MPGYCSTTDVQNVLQETNTDFGTGALGTSFVEASIKSVSDWLHHRSNAHWYDSNKTSDDTLSHQAVSASSVRLDVPSSPHQQEHQLYAHHQGARYPVTHSGPYARIRLPHATVDTLNALEVRDRGGSVTDWTTSTEYAQGRGEDYYLETDGGDAYHTSYLYLRAASIGPRQDYQNLLTLDYDYGLDYQSSEWESVKRGVAALAAADLVMDDDVQTAIPNDGQLISIETEADRLVKQGMRHLEPHLRTPIA